MEERGKKKEKEQKNNEYYKGLDYNGKGRKTIRKS